MSNNVVLIGVSSYEYINIMCSYYPRGINENFDVVFIIDEDKVSSEGLLKIFNEHDLDTFKSAKFINKNDIIEHYIQKLNIQDTVTIGKITTWFAKPPGGYWKDVSLKLKGNATFARNYVLSFKIPAPQYVIDTMGYDKVFLLDDDIFIFNDISDIFKYDKLMFKKDALFRIGNTKSDITLLDAYNDIFETSFSREDINSLPINSGSILYMNDSNLDYYFKRFIENEHINKIYYFNVSSKNNQRIYSTWTLEQRFWHFYMVKTIKEGRGGLLSNQEVKVLINSGIPKDKYLTVNMPKILHYAIGKQKTDFLTWALPGLSWKYDGFKYEPKYELTHKLVKIKKCKLF